MVNCYECFNGGGFTETTIFLFSSDISAIGDANCQFAPRKCWIELLDAQVSDTTEDDSRCAAGSHNSLNN